MDIRIVNRWRHATIAPTKAATAKNTIETMEHLYRHFASEVHSGQIEYEVDQEFADALDAAIVRNRNTTDWSSDGSLQRRFRGVPIVVREG